MRNFRMSSNRRCWFFITTSLATGLFFFFFGLFSAILPWSFSLQNALNHFIAIHYLSLCLYGIALCSIGILIILHTYQKNKHHYVSMCIGKWNVTLDENVVRQYLETYWKKYMPNESIPFSLSFQKRSLHITAEFPPLSLEEQRELLEQIQSDFSDLFGRILGYPHEVHLKARFR